MFTSIAFDGNDGPVDCIELNNDVITGVHDEETSGVLEVPAADVSASWPLPNGLEVTTEGVTLDQLSIYSRAAGSGDVQLSCCARCCCC